MFGARHFFGDVDEQVTFVDVSIQLTGSTYSASLLDHQPNASLFDLMEEIERRIIADRLERCHWNHTDAAEYFKIPLSTLNQKIKRLNVEIKKRGRE